MFLRIILYARGRLATMLSPYVVLRTPQQHSSMHTLLKLCSNSCDAWSTKTSARGWGCRWKLGGSPSERGPRLHEDGRVGPSGLRHTGYFVASHPRRPQSLVRTRGYTSMRRGVDTTGVDIARTWDGGQSRGCRGGRRSRISPCSTRPAHL